MNFHLSSECLLQSLVAASQEAILCFPLDLNIVGASAFSISASHPYAMRGER